ncbi:MULTISPECIES: Fic family protein [unclassified Lysobacter]|uniref:Fic family protein n=1 Tax=unclassified Lysobacter TaxID=2635362 RepID=UPI001BE972E2|nr:MULTISPECIES: Fic family protein [unclassified Lysobacter]MBT2748324.1 Fic family protein [Lysobacter sp. ISL-42]MBT2749909.1 Fic family protein [Lysobacter sp. ISL-50]MBT2781237.1 Fic family protein [Lysobacter sp. ISL-52]
MIRAYRTPVDLPNPAMLAEPVARRWRALDERVSEIGLARTKSPLTHSWFSKAGARARHPLSHHAEQQHGPIHLRRDGDKLEIAAAGAVASRLTRALDRSDTAQLVAIAIEAADRAGVTGARLRSSAAGTTPDRKARVIMFLPTSAIAHRLSTLAAYANLPALPRSLRAIALQAAWLNLHPLADGNGRTGRILLNSLLWGDDAGSALYLPLYGLRSHLTYSYELALRSAELHARWEPLLELFEGLVDTYLEALRHNERPEV